MTMQPATNQNLAKAIQAVIKEYVQADIAQSGNHCPRCALARAHAHLEAVQETYAAILDISQHNHRVPKAQPAAEVHEEE